MANCTGFRTWGHWRRWIFYHEIWGMYKKQCAWFLWRAHSVGVHHYNTLKSCQWPPKGMGQVKRLEMENSCCLRLVPKLSSCVLCFWNSSVLLPLHSAFWIHCAPVYCCSILGWLLLQFLSSYVVIHLSYTSFHPPRHLPLVSGLEAPWEQKQRLFVILFVCFSEIHIILELFKSNERDSAEICLRTMY